MMEVRMKKVHDFYVTFCTKNREKKPSNEILFEVNGNDSISSIQLTKNDANENEYF